MNAKCQSVCTASCATRNASRGLIFWQQRRNFYLGECARACVCVCMTNVVAGGVPVTVWHISIGLPRVASRWVVYLSACVNGAWRHLERIRIRRRCSEAPTNHDLGAKPLLSQNSPPSASLIVNLAPSFVSILWPLFVASCLRAPPWYLLSSIFWFRWCRLFVPVCHATLKVVTSKLVRYNGRH